MTGELKDALILAPTGRDASVAAALLAEDGFSSKICGSLSECIDAFENAFCFVVTAEALIGEDRTRFAEWVGAQPAWSDFPTVLLTERHGTIDARLGFLTEFAITLERPFSPQALVAAVRSAVRARRRQLEVKSLLDERDRSDERQRLLIRELHHRVKNTLANVQAVLGATARSSETVDGFYKAFSARVHSLARTHSFLTDDYWQTASLEDMLKAELAHYDSGGKVHLHGPAVALNADQAIPLGMAIHELATNCVKYGALSVPAGMLKVDWTATAVEGEELLSLTWREIDGPQVKAQTRKGFGTMLFERVLAVQLNAEVDMDFHPTGLRFRLSVPLKTTRLVPEYHSDASSAV